MTMHSTKRRDPPHTITTVRELIEWSKKEDARMTAELEKFYEAALCEMADLPAFDVEGLEPS